MSTPITYSGMYLRLCPTQIHRPKQHIMLMVNLKYVYSLFSILLDPCYISRSRALCNKERLRLLQVLTNTQTYTTNAI